MAAKTQITASHICYACGRNRPRRLLGFDPDTLKTYCWDESRCRSDNRPNKDLLPINYQSVISYYESFKPESVTEGLKKCFGKSISVRATPAQIIHLLKISQEYALDSINAVLSHILEEHMQEHPLDDVDLEECFWDVLKRKPKSMPKPKPQPVPKPKPEKQKPDPDDDGGEIIL